MTAVLVAGCIAAGGCKGWVLPPPWRCDAQRGPPHAARRYAKKAQATPGFDADAGQAAHVHSCAALAQLAEQCYEQAAKTFSAIPFDGADGLEASLIPTLSVRPSVLVVAALLIRMFTALWPTP